jgi:hypothetical protein
MSKTPVTKIITGCNDCPFCVYIDAIADMPSNGLCNIEADDNNGKYTSIEMDRGNFITPEWCPLKIQPIIVSYE